MVQRFHFFQALEMEDLQLKISVEQQKLETIMELPLVVNKPQSRFWIIESKSEGFLESPLMTSMLPTRNIKLHKKFCKLVCQIEQSW